MLDGKVALVTGGSRGIGHAIAGALLKSGARVAITATSDETLRKATDQLTAAADKASLLPIKADARRHADVVSAVRTVSQQFGGIDVLVNNAGVGIFRSVADMAIEDWHKIIDTNLTGAFYFCQAALPHLRARRGWIINISSLSGKHPFAQGAAYCASKAALNAFSEALMQEVRHDGVRVAFIAPGSVRTGFGTSGAGNDDWKLAPDDVAHVVTDLLSYPSRSLPGSVEIRPSQPPRKSR